MQLTTIIPSPICFIYHFVNKKKAEKSWRIFIQFAGRVQSCYAHMPISLCGFLVASLVSLRTPFYGLYLPKEKVKMLLLCLFQSMAPHMPMLSLLLAIMQFTQCAKWTKLKEREWEPFVVVVVGLREEIQKLMLLDYCFPESFVWKENFSTHIPSALSGFMSLALKLCKGFFETLFVLEDFKGLEM